MSWQNISPAEYDGLQRFLADSIGLILGEGREYLVTARLRPIMSEYGFSTIWALLKGLESGQPPALRALVIDAMTTQETSWLRDRYPFQALARIMLPSLIGQPRVRIWSAACATGQETYSIAMTVETFKQDLPAAMAVEILGTDISPQAIAMATRGCYPASLPLRGLDPVLTKRFFQLRDDCWEVAVNLREMVRFRIHNLLDSYAPLGRFDIIFCRNSLIYFALDTRCDILRKIGQVLKPGGFLMLGGSESIANCPVELTMHKTEGGVYYRKQERTTVVGHERNNRPALSG